MQVTSDISEHLQAQAADGFLNLLLLAHSSLDDTNTALGQQESRPGHCQAAEDALTQSATDSSACDDQNQQRSAQASEADPKHEHQTVAGIVCMRSSSEHVYMWITSCRCTSIRHALQLVNACSVPHLVHGYRRFEALCNRICCIIDSH